MAKDIYVVAHTQSEHHVQGLVGGWYDSDLTDLGRRQAEAVADRLAEALRDQPDVETYASDLKRASQTADAIARRLSRPVVLLPDLRERSAGIAGGKPAAWLHDRAIPPPRGDGRLDHDQGVEGAETTRAFATRVYRALQQILASDCPAQVIVTHGFVVTQLIAAWIRMPLESVGWAHFKSNAGGITLLQEDDDFFDRVVTYLNDRDHLAGVSPAPA
ncbi:MAG TPA: histidine phosphatase family protein [Caulobacteraceae bacterium]|jgi:probable phosphoglycerate mutase|nr:histidine phosphatase family protein [Caulobacteraceae bacterium]